MMTCEDTDFPGFASLGFVGCLQMCSVSCYFTCSFSLTVPPCWAEAWHALLLFPWSPEGLFVFLHELFSVFQIWWIPWMCPWIRLSILSSVTSTELIQHDFITIFIIYAIVMQFYISHLVLFLNIYDIWFTSPASQNFQDWARPKAEAWTLVSPTWATETQVLEPVPAVSRVHGAHIQGTHPQVGCVRLQLRRCVLTQTWAAVPIPCFSADFFPTFLFQENL